MAWVNTVADRQLSGWVVMISFGSLWDKRGNGTCRPTSNQNTSAILKISGTEVFIYSLIFK